MKEEKYNLTVPTDGSQAFTVPNNAAGKAFIELLRAFINRKHYTIRMRGRHSNRNAAFKKYQKKHPGWLPNYDRDVPLEVAETIAIYLEADWERKRQAELYVKECEVTRLEGRVYNARQIFRNIIEEVNQIDLT